MYAEPRTAPATPVEYFGEFVVGTIGSVAERAQALSVDGWALVAVAGQTGIFHCVFRRDSRPT